MADQNFNVNCGFFDSVNSDRTYSAEQMNQPYKRLISNGVFATKRGTPSTDLQVVTANNGMKILVKKGEGIFADKWFENPSDLTITVPSNSSIIPRRDSVIVQIDNTTNGRVGRIVYRTGTPASYPLPPDIGTVDNVIEYRVANIYVAASATWISQDAITDLRGSDECPWITSLINQVDTSTLYAQWQAAYQNYYNTETEAFNAFMESLTSELAVNTNIITYESHYISQVLGTTEIPINIANYNKNKDVLMVRVNGLFTSENTDYTISNDSSKITLTKDLDANQNVDFLVLQSVVVGDTATVLQQVQTLASTVNSMRSDTGWINFILESGAASFDNTTTPAVRKYDNKVHIKGSIKGFNTLNTTICTLPENMRPAMNYQYTSCAVANGSIVATCVFEISTTGTIKLIAKSGNIATTNMLPISTSFIVG